MTDPLVEEGLRVKTDPFAKATPRPWAFCEIGDYDDFDGNSRVLLGGDMRIAVVHAGGPNAEENEANAALIVAAVNALPALLDERDRLAKRIVFDLEPRALAAESLLAALGERVKELEAGLLPFANLGVTSGPDDEPCSIPYRITRGSIRRARALLQPQGGE